MPSVFDRFKLTELADETARRVQERNALLPENQRLQIGNPRKLDKRDNMLLLHFLGPKSGVTKNRKYSVVVRNKAVVIRYGAEA